jgi:hypothetical protein
MCGRVDETEKNRGVNSQLPLFLIKPLTPLSPPPPPPCLKLRSLCYASVDMLRPAYVLVCAGTYAV